MTMNIGMHDSLRGILPISLSQTNVGALLNALHGRWNTCRPGAYIDLTFEPFAFSINFLLVCLGFSKLTARKREVQ
jgi:hypothetical protein